MNICRSTSQLSICVFLFLYMVPYLQHILLWNIYFGAFWDKFALYLNLARYPKIGTRTAPSNYAFKDKLIEHHEHQSTKEDPYSMPNLQFCGLNIIFYSIF